MNKDLLTYLEKERSEELFYFFKHDGLINFEKKIVSGVILNKRRYDKRKLKSEKSIIRNSIVNDIKTCENSPQLVSELKVKVIRSIVFGIMITVVLSLLPFSINYMKSGSFLLSNDYSLLLAGMLLILFIVYRIATYNKSLKKLINLKMEDCEILKDRLKILDKEWQF